MFILILSIVITLWNSSKAIYCYWFYILNTTVWGSTAELCVGERRLTLFLFIYQLLVEMEIFLRAAQDVSLSKLPFIFEKLKVIFITQCKLKSSRKSLTPEVKVKTKQKTNKTKNPCRNKEKKSRTFFTLLYLIFV